MPNDYFEFKQFRIRQDKCAMKVGTDGVLLGAWVQATGNIRVLDIGTGTGLIALMVAQKTIGVIDAVELDSDAAMQAKENFEHSPWSARLNCYHQSIQDYSISNFKKYDLIISNPPYYNAGQRSSSSNRAMARHIDTLTLKQLIMLARERIYKTGIIALVLPFEKRRCLMEQLIVNGLWVVREARIRPLPNHNFTRIMLEISIEMPEQFIVEEIIIEQLSRHNYHTSFIECTKDYYFKF